jgi:DNA-binding CsgD family transcriptional regulator
MRQLKAFPTPAIPEPHALAGTRRELVAAAACCAALIPIFLADVLTPSDVVLTALAVFPILIAMWTFSSRPAGAVAGLAGALLLIEVLIGSINVVTAAAEVLAYASLAMLTRLYARALAGDRQGRREPASGIHLELLTRREREVVALAAHGRTAPEIADVLHIGERTVETHLANAYPKLGVRSKLELVKQAANLGTSAA